MNHAGAVRLAAVCLLLLSAGSAGCATPGRERAEGQIVATLREQDQAWNRGDLDAFMSYYWKSPDLTFSSGGKTTRGWAPTLAGYQARYPTREIMGTLSFSELEVQFPARNVALVLGRWHLDRSPDPVGGNFSLLMKRMGGRWLIVHDHTSSDPKPAPSAAIGGA